MKKYRYELHAHTAEGSRCSKISAIDLVRYYKDNGYDGIFITDHFTGSTTVPKGTPWNERIDMFYHNGFEIAAEEGRRIGLKVFWAPEFSSKCNDFLFLGLSKEWWKEQSDYFELPINDQLDRVRNAGGFIIHAHPFAEAPWIECIRLFPRKADAVEIFNGGCGREINERAYMYAESYGLLMTGGTDTHSGHEKNFCGIETDTECYNVHDIVDAIREKRAHPFSQMHQDILK